MPPDTNIPPANPNPQIGSQPPLPPAPAPPVISAPPPTLPGTKPSHLRKLIAILLSLYLGLFLADAIVSLADDSLKLFAGHQLFTAMRAILSLLVLFGALVVYGLIGLTPMVPKRFFLPATLFNPLVVLAVFPVMIYFYGQRQQAAWVISLCQVIFALAVLVWIQGGFKPRWPLISANQLGTRSFSWRNLLAFVLVNIFVVPPVVMIYLAICASLAVGHFTEGFVSLRPGGVAVKARKYVRNDGKTIQLIPMAHVGDSAFYQKVSQSFPTNSVVLLEGVSDEGNLLTNRITYQRMATSLGLSEQQKEFQPTRGELVRADVDVRVFATSTIDFLNLVMLLHSKGWNMENVLKLLDYQPPPDVEEQLWNDLLKKRNRHLLGEIQNRLPDSEIIIVPWGAAHIPELAREIQKSGFRLDETQEYTVIRFRLAGGNPKSAP